jgi:heat shock protein HslJ
MRVHRLLIPLLVLAALAAAGCDEGAPAGSAGSPGPPAAAVEGPTWTAIAIGGQPPVPGHEPSIQLVGGRVRGSGGCNGFSRGYRYDERTGTIAFDNLAMTAMGCLDPRVGPIETAFSGILAGADRLALDADGRLHVTGPAGEIVLAKALEG